MPPERQTRAVRPSRPPPTRRRAPVPAPVPARGLPSSPAELQQRLGNRGAQALLSRIAPAAEAPAPAPIATSKPVPAATAAPMAGREAAAATPGAESRLPAAVTGTVEPEPTLPAPAPTREAEAGETAVAAAPASAAAAPPEAAPPVSAPPAAALPAEGAAAAVPAGKMAETRAATVPTEEAAAPPKPVRVPEGTEAGAPAPAEGEGLPTTAPGAERPPEAMEMGVEKAAITAEDPGAILQQLAGVPPSQSLAAYDQAETASAVALQNQTSKLEASLPEIPAPTGLTPGLGKQEKGSEATAPARASVTLDGEQSGGVAEAYDTSVGSAPPPPPPTATILRGADVSDTGEPSAEIAASAQQALDSIGLNTRAISANAGERPTVDLAGQADPAQLETFKGSTDTQVARAKGEAAADIQRDRGEFDIFPAPTGETLSAKKTLSTKTPAGPKGAGGPRLAPDVTAGLDRSLGPVYRQRVGEKHTEYLAGEGQFDRDVATARQDADTETGRLNTETQHKQLQEQRSAQAQVAGYRAEWQAEVDQVDQDYAEKANKATTEQRDKIAREKLKGEEKAGKHLDEAERKAAAEKLKAERDAAREKQKTKKKSSGFFGWVRRAASAVIDVLKKAVNFIYDKLRQAVKLIFEAAKRLVQAAIELARMAIVGLIKGLGMILKGLVSVVFAAFPRIAARINSKIDKAVNVAVEVVNTAADFLKKAVAAVLDFLANTIDSLLGLVQSLFNGLFTVLGMLIRGEFMELMERIGSLVQAAKEMSTHLEGAIWEQLLGVDISKPIPGEAGYVAAGGAAAGPAAAGVAPAGGALSDADVAVEPLLSEPLDPELVADLDLDDGQERVLGERSGEAFSTAAILADFEGPGPEAVAPELAVAEKAAEKSPTPAMSRGERAGALWNQMKTFMANWFRDNWGKLLLALIAALLGAIALTIVTGGAIWVAVPLIMKIIAAVFVGVAIIKAAGYIRTYLAEGWEKRIVPAAKALANAAAVGIVEVAMALGFRAVGVAAKGAAKVVAAGARLTARGVRAAAASAASGIKRLLKSGATLASKSGTAVIRRGKLIFQGLKSGALKGVKKVKDLVSRLFNRFRIKRISVERRGRRIMIWGHFNPKILMYNGEIIEVRAKRGEGRLKPHDRALLEEPGRRARTGIVLKKELATHLEGLTDAQRRTAYRNLRDWRKIHPKKTLELHHIATNKNFQLGKQWSRRFKKLFKKAGRGLDDEVNKVLIPSHSGPHSDAYHQWIFDRLDMALSGVKGKSKIRAALDVELKAVASELAKDPRKLWP